MRTTRGTNPEREAVKEYLQQYHDAKAKKQILEERHRTLSADLRDPGVGSAYRTMPTSKRQAREGGAVSLVYRIAEVEDRIGQQREAMAKAVLHVMDMIDILPPKLHGAHRGGNAAHRLQALGEDRPGRTHEPVPRI